jgi:uncharacterized protein YndB with AHSA1/START domain
MPVKKDASGRRSVEASVEVPGTPEQVWQAIATGPGISSWFVPSQVEERIGGTATSNFGPGMESTATITAWEPPRRVAMDSRDDMGPEAPTIATEWTVEARSGDTCVVRVVHSWFTDRDDWDKQFEGHEHGWVAFFRILRLYLSHFAGKPSAAFQVMGMMPGTTDTAWASLTTSLGLSGVVEGQRVRSAHGQPRLGGVVERVGPPEFPELLLRLDTPAPGIAHFFAMRMGGNAALPIRVFLYGEQAGQTAEIEGSVWQEWISERVAS